MKLITVKEFARRVGVSRACILYHIKKGRLTMRAAPIMMVGLDENDVGVAVNLINSKRVIAHKKKK